MVDDIEVGEDRLQPGSTRGENLDLLRRPGEVSGRLCGFHLDRELGLELGELADGMSPTIEEKGPVAPRRPGLDRITGLLGARLAEGPDDIAEVSMDPRRADKPGVNLRREIATRQIGRAHV